MSAIRPDALPVLVARGFVRAATAWKELLILLAVNGLLAVAFAWPASLHFHAALDDLPGAGQLVHGDDVTFVEHFARSHPDLLGGSRSLARLAGGEGGGASLLTGFGGTLLALGLINALVASFFSGGFAARFAEGKGGSVGDFLSAAARVAPASLCLSLFSAAGIAGAFWGLFLAPGKLTPPGSLTFEWEAVGLALLRLSAFLVAAGLVRMTVLAARAAMADSGRANPFMALATGAGRVVGHPIKALAIEVSFSLLAFAPLILWGLFAPVWDGADLQRWAILVGGQQLLVLWRIAVRASHLGAVGAWMRKAPAETAV